MILTHKLSKIALHFSELSNARKEAYEAKLELEHTKEKLNNLTARVTTQHAGAAPEKDKAKNK